MCKKDILELDYIEKPDYIIPAKYRKKANEFFIKADKSYQSIINYIEKNIDETQKNKLIDMLEEYYADCDDFYTYNEKIHFIAGKADGIKIMAAIYNLD